MKKKITNIGFLYSFLLVSKAQSCKEIMVYVKSKGYGTTYTTYDEAKQFPR